MPIPVTGLATALCGLLLVALAARVSQLRMRHRVALGDGGNAELGRAIRAHGNTAEHAPIFLLMSACSELLAGPTWLLAALVALFLLGRLLLVWGLVRAPINSARRNGAALTYLSQLLLALLLLVQLVRGFAA
ncbi:MAG: MAPEG family protein [Stagnimonas sp.]|nr:MAPEG family protein [Stagnimonas sp.]